MRFKKCGNFSKLPKGEEKHALLFWGILMVNMRFKMMWFAVCIKKCHRARLSLQQNSLSQAPIRVFILLHSTVFVDLFAHCW